MKRFLPILLWAISLGAAYGQRSEFSVQASSGLFSFRGSGALSQTTKVLMEPGLYHPHGRSSGFSYGLTGQWQYVGRTGVVAGVQLGYESLTSRLAVTQLVGDFSTSWIDGGQGWLKNQYILLQPFVGKRLGSKLVSLDVTAGVDLAYGLSSRDAYSLSTDGAGATLWQSEGIYHAMPTVDLRPRLNLAGYYRAFGLSAGYSMGVLSYTPSSRADATQVYSQYWRFGVAYRFN